MSKMTVLSEILGQISEIERFFYSFSQFVVHYWSKSHQQVWENLSGYAPHAIWLISQPIEVLETVHTNRNVELNLFYGFNASTWYWSLASSNRHHYHHPRLHLWVGLFRPFSIGSWAWCIECERVLQTFQPDFFVRKVVTYFQWK